tara:strand:- start:6682 stop:7833 length:1152 start_codon:yes stop_codon:yes gene_type:complete
MNPYELFWNYHHHRRLPYLAQDHQYESSQIKSSLADRKTLQLVLLMYKERGEHPTYLQQLLDDDIVNVCDKLERANLVTPRYVPRNTDPPPPETNTGQRGETKSGTLEGGTAIPPLTINRGTVPQTKQETTLCKQTPVLLCDTLFLGSFHSRRLLSLAKLNKAVVDMEWVRAVASKVVGMDETGFCILDKRPQYEDRHVHHHGGVLEFLRLYLTMNDKTVDTFSLENSDFAIHMQDFRTRMNNHLRRGTSDRRNATSLVGESLSLTMLACAIGVPVRRMYTPANFMSKWKSFRFFNVNRENVIRTMLRGQLNSEQVVGNETAQLLLNYQVNQELFTVGLDNLNTTQQTVTTYFYNQWYSYPTMQELSTIIIRLNAIKQQCLHR